MTDSLEFHTAEPDDVLDAFARRLAEPLKHAPHPDADFAGRVMAEVRSGAAPAAPAAPGRTATPWWRTRWQLSVSPIGALGILAAAAGVVFMLRTASPTSARTPVDTAVSAIPAGMQLVRFELSAAPGARVSLVGAFNGWDSEATTLTPVGTPDAAGKQRYTVSVALPRGRHEYAFVLDDSTWTEDPAAASHRDEFGARTSVVVVDEPVAASGRRNASS